jgi:hypothetical protein
MTEMSSSDPLNAAFVNGASPLRRIVLGRSIDAAFLRVLEARSFNGRVHSVFTRVVNIECTTGKLFTLAGSGLDNAPNTAIVGVTDFDACDIAVNDPVAATKGELLVGDCVVVHWTAASIWRAQLPRYADADGNLQARLDWVQSYLVRNGAQGGFVGQAPSDNAFARQMGITLKHRSGSLLDALERMHMSTACQHAKSMIGLGPGLTPAGDDFLVGLFAVLNLRGSPCCGWLSGGKDVLLHAEQLTNAISLAALVAAANGQVRETISRLIETLICGTLATLTESLDRVLAIGSTSGSDLVAGILAGLKLNLRIEAIGSSNSP